MSTISPKYAIDNSQAFRTYIGDLYEYAAALISCGSDITSLNCYELNCGACSGAAGSLVYDRCPDCGAGITGAVGSTKCVCGTWMWVCTGKVVRYIIPNEVAKSAVPADDII